MGPIFAVVDLKIMNQYHQFSSFFDKFQFEEISKQKKPNV